MNWKKQILLQAVMFAVALPTIQAADAEDYPPLAEGYGSGIQL